jgi:hypothetical protein
LPRPFHGGDEKGVIFPRGIADNGHGALDEIATHPQNDHVCCYAGQPRQMEYQDSTHKQNYWQFDHSPAVLYECN